MYDQLSDGDALPILRRLAISVLAFFSDCFCVRDEQFVRLTNATPFGR